jgi:methionyl-tRNA formyltransferase|tara:strand:- start:92 stop:880 length:789 start_codon:yes stop_codon:yes gene_type:complete
MKITLFTANQNRHNYLVNLLSNNCDELFVVQENRTIFPGIVPGHYSASEIMKKYFKNVINAQSKIFENPHINIKNKNIHLFPLQSGDLNKCSIDTLSDFLKSDVYVVFGSSYIKGDLVDFLVKNKALNIHMGVSPYYRGTDCNFWALYDDNPHLVGATIHKLSKKLDGGAMLYHALSQIKNNPFEYTMSTVKSAFHSLAERIKNESIFSIQPEIQNKNKEVRYSKKDEFNEDVVKLFLNKQINLNSYKFDKKLFKDPYILKS